MEKSNSFSLTVVLIMALLGPLASHAQATHSIAQLLGFNPQAKLLIIHADDIGMSHSVNQATFAAMHQGSINSGSIMVPCPWFPAAAAHYRANPSLDLGLHLTLTAEWRDYKWSSLSASGPAHGLHTDQGYQYSNVADVVENASVNEVTAELIAQIEAAYAAGIKPTHLDSHMGTLFASPEFFAAYVAMGRKFKLPILIPRQAISEQAPHLLDGLRANEIVVDRIHMATPSLEASQWSEFYDGLITNLEPGITQIIIHAGYANEELNAITIEHPDYGAQWRDRDTRYFSSPATLALLEEHNVQLVTWREIGAVVYPH